VEIAARLGSDPQWGNSIVEKTVANYSLLYSDRRCLEALEEFYRRAVDERLAANRTGLNVARNVHK